MATSTIPPVNLQGITDQIRSIYGSGVGSSQSGQTGARSVQDYSYLFPTARRAGGNIGTGSGSQDLKGGLKDSDLFELEARGSSPVRITEKFDEFIRGLFGGGPERPPEPFYGSPFKQAGIPQYDPSTGFFAGIENPASGKVEDANPLKKSRVERQSEASTRALINTLPAALQAINAQILPNELAQLQSSLLTSPLYAQLQQDIFRQNALANAQTEKDILLGPGMDVVNIANQLQRGIDPEYYSVRSNTGDVINQQLAGPTGSERAELERSLGRGSVGRGDWGVNSNLNTVSNALNFGDLAHQRQSDAINRAIAFLSQGARSGPDVLQQAIKSPSQISGSYANAREQSGQTPQAIGGQNMNTLLNLIPQLQQVDASRPKNIDRVFQGINAASQLLQAGGSFFM